jgi:hypothetical protein
MHKIAATAAVILLTCLSPSGFAQNHGWTSTMARPRPVYVATVPVLQEADIAGLRAALNLTPAQHAYWQPVEAVLNDLLRWQSRAEAPGAARRWRGRPIAIAITAEELHRLRSSAMPLIKALTDGQKNAAIAFAQRMGYGSLIALF